jgi:hypothetical protein
MGIVLKNTRIDARLAAASSGLGDGFDGLMASGLKERRFSELNCSRRKKVDDEVEK